jgi:hypothetical protein
MGKLNTQLVEQEINSGSQTAVTEAPPTPTPTPDTNIVPDAPVEESLFAKNKNLILVAVLLVAGYFVINRKK